MNGPLLPSLEIKNFRAFRHLRINHLARVNLIVGRNNVGKTSLLEALWLYAQRGVPAAIWDQLTFREQSAERRLFSTSYPSVLAVRNLFFERPDVFDRGATLEIGPVESRKDRLTIAIEHHPDTSSQQRGVVPFFVLRQGDEPRLFTQLISSTPDISYLPNQSQILYTMVTTNGLTRDDITNLWDRIALTDLENYVVNAYPRHNRWALGDA